MSHVPTPHATPKTGALLCNQRSACSCVLAQINADGTSLALAANCDPAVVVAACDRLARGGVASLADRARKLRHDSDQTAYCRDA